MALQHGTRDRLSGRRASTSDVVGRAIGFLMVGGPAVAILAGVVLLPPYAALARTEYELGCKQATVADGHAQFRARERLIGGLQKDEVLIKRVAENQLRCRPWNEIVIPSPRPQNRPPDLVTPKRHRRPVPPPQWLMTAARKLSDPPMKRAMVLLGFGALVTAIYLFTPPQWPSRQR